MNIYTVRDNLKTTIAGKRGLLESMQARKDVSRAMVDQVAFISTINFLEVNLDELSKILADVEICCEQAVQASWAANPDRSGA